MATVNEALVDRAIRHAAVLARYGNGLSDKLVRLLNTADAEIVERLAARLALIEERGYDLGPATTARLRDTLEEVRALNAAIYAQVASALTDELVEFASAEAAFQRDALDAALSISLETKLPAPARLRAIVTEAPMEGRLLSSWTAGMEQGRIDRIGQAVRLGMLEGESTDKIVRRIRGTKAAQYNDGVLNISRRSAQAVVRTSVTHVSNVAAQETWKANDHVVKGWQFVATRDSRTTSTCASKDGKVFPIGEGPIPPLHRNCRSTTVGVTKSFRDLGVDRDELSPAQRASMDGQVAGRTTYPDWLKRQSAARQEEVLGKKRAELFRAGKLSYADLVRSEGQFLTLEQLKRQYPGLLS